MNYTRRAGAKVCILLQLFVSITLGAVDIIIDLGGVLIKTKKMKSASNIGTMNLCAHTLTHWKNPRKELYAFLTRVKTNTSDFGKFVAYDEKHTKLPCVMCDWLKGVPSKKILKRIQKKEPSKFTWKLAQTVFNPRLMSESKRIIKRGEDFIKNCVAQGHRVYVLANQDTETFSLMKQKFPDFFDLFSGIVISGDCKLVKPDPAIFDYIIATYQLDPQNCLFIDDQIENIESAKKLGIPSLRVSNRKDKHFKTARSLLQISHQKSTH
jgi:FMN phosphatase YigB (HAD superfamily)